MTYFLLLVLAFLLAFCQFVFLPFNLVFLTVLVFSWRLPEKKALFFSFFAGLIKDLAGASSLGFSSAGFLLISGFLIYLKDHFTFNSFLARFFVFFFLFILERLIFEHDFFLGQDLIMGLAAVVLAGRRAEKIKL